MSKCIKNLRKENMGAPLISYETKNSYDLNEKEKIYREYFTKQNLIIKSLEGMERHNSVVNDEIVKDNRLIFELLKMRG